MQIGNNKNNTEGKSSVFENICWLVIKLIYSFFFKRDFKFQAKMLKAI